MVSRKQKKHELVDDLLPIINKRLDEERHVARVEMCMILSKELYMNSKLLCQFIPDSFKFCKGFKKDGTHVLQGPKIMECVEVI